MEKKSRERGREGKSVYNKIVEKDGELKFESQDVEVGEVVDGGSTEPPSFAEGVKMVQKKKKRTQRGGT